MMELSAAELGKALSRLGERFDVEADRLSRLDELVGDGDHGRNMSRGFRKASEAIRTGEKSTVETLMSRYADGFSKGAGGASGALFGLLFTAIGESIGGKAAVTPQDLVGGLHGALAEIQETAGAAPGDRTLVDALHVGTKATEALVSSGNPGIVDALRAARDGARQGADETAGMVPRKGRAKFVSDEPVDAPDAGAESVAVLFDELHRLVSLAGKQT